MVSSLRRAAPRRWVLAGVVGALSIGLVGFAYTSADQDAFSPVADNIPRGGTIKAGPPQQNTPYLLHTSVGGGEGAMYDVLPVEGKGKGQAGGAAEEAGAPERKAQPGNQNDKKNKKKNDKNKKNKGKNKGNKGGTSDFTGDAKMAFFENDGGVPGDPEASARKYKLFWWYARDVKTVGKSYEVRWENLALKGQCLAGDSKNIGLKRCDAKDKSQRWLNTPMKGLRGYKATNVATKLAMATKLTSKNIMEMWKGIEVLNENPIPDLFPKKIGGKPKPGELFYWDDCNCGPPEI